ncbi:hypothetical protein BDZ85DRAFT_265899 [Elsinoe ampelina]|uniref:HORMA domain-containing protein n=1 Tax=Elsinoe ampelina TaxID=302913 RepID=A0A6A6G562_9PEZI|nr:hypothetical protein BDZ85DRAFT_265899 [Elsinoe ampelina]
MEDPRHPNNVLESYTLMVEHDGLFVVDASHSPRPDPKSLAVITVIRSLARSFEDFQNFFVDMAPLPEQAYVAFQTLHTDRKTHPPIGMTETWGEPSVLPVKEGWKPIAYRPQAVHLGTREYEALHLGAIAMKSSKSGNRVPIRTASCPSLTYTDAISAEKETTSMLFDAVGLVDKTSGHLNDDLDEPNGVTDSVEDVSYQKRHASLGDRGRKDHLKNMAETASTGPTQADTQIRIPDTYDTTGEDSHGLFESTNPKFPAPDQDNGQDRPLVMSCICGIDQAEGRILRCEKCQTGQHGHCYGYFAINLSMNEIEHICFGCAPMTKDASQETIEKHQSTALLRTLIHHLREEKPMTVKELSSKIDKDLDVTQDLVNTLHTSGIISRKDRRRAQPLWTLSTGTEGIREMKRLYWSEVRIRKPAEPPTPVIPRSPSALKGRTRSHNGKRPSMPPLPNDGSHGTPLKRARTSKAPHDTIQQSTTPIHRTRGVIPQTPRRSPRLAYQTRYQHDQVFLVSATFRTPPEAEG